MKNSSPTFVAQQFPRLRLARHALAVAAAFGSAVIAPWATTPGWANPTGPQVVAGQASVNAAGANLTVTNSPGAVLNWQSFSIGANETTKFVQQNAQSAVLNRVVGVNGAVDPSVIAGQLQSNGKVFLINPQGIVFGAGAKVDVGGLVASTLDISNQDFQAGRLNLKAGPNGSGAVKVDAGANIATPTGGQVYLVGKDVSNSGIIRTPQGQVILAAGSEVQILDSSTPGVRVVFKADNNKAENLGEISAGSGQVGIYGAALRNKGIINADQISRDAQGRIVLKATKSVTLESGSTITANGARGGSISITADGVAGQQAIKVEGNTLTSANGQSSAGGAITLRAAHGSVSVDQRAVISANGAPAGTILIQADQGRATVSGEVSARGVAPVQTTLFKPASTQVSAVAGDVVISTAPANSETVAANAVSDATGGTVHVLGVEVGLYGTGALIDASGPAGGGTVLVGGDFQGKSPSVQNARGTYFGADATIKADATLTGNGGKVIVWADVSTHAHGAIDVRGGTNGGDGGFVETSGKEFLLATRAPLINARYAQSQHGQWLLDPDDLTISAAADSGIVGTPPTYSSGGAPSNLSTATLNAALDAGGTVTLTAGNSITVAANVSKTTGANSTLVLTAVNGVTINGGVSISSTANQLNFTAEGGTGLVTFLSGASLTTNGGSVRLNTAGSIDLVGTASINSGNGAIAMTAGGGGGPGISIGNSVVVNAGSGAINLSGTGAAAGGDGVYINGSVAGGAITISGYANYVYSRGIQFSDDSGGTGTVTGSSITVTAYSAGTVGTTANAILINYTGGGPINTLNTSVGGGKIFIAADDLFMSPSAQFNAGAGDIQFTTRDPSRLIKLGDGGVGGAFSRLQNTAVSQFVSSGRLIIGDSSTAAGSGVNHTGGIEIDALFANGPNRYSLLSPGGTVSATGSGILSTNAFYVEGTTVALANTAHPITQIAGRVGAGGINYSGQGNVAVKAYAGLPAGLEATGGGSIVLTAGTSSGSITQDAGANITGSALTALVPNSVGTVALNNTGNSVSTLFATTNGGDISFINGGTFSVGTAASVNAINTSGGNVTLAAASGSINLTGSAGANAILVSPGSGTGNINISALGTGGAIVVNNTIQNNRMAGNVNLTANAGITVAANLRATDGGAINLNVTAPGGFLDVAAAASIATQGTTSGNIELVADSLTVNSVAGSIDSGATGNVTIKPWDPSRQISVGTAGAGLHVSNTALAAVSTQAGYQLYVGGGSQVGNITFDGAVVPDSIGEVSVFQATGGAGSIGFAGAGVAVNSTSVPMWFNAGTGGISSTVPPGTAAISGVPTLRLNTSGAIGTVGAPLNISATNTLIGMAGLVPNSAYVKALGSTSLNLLNVTGAATIQATEDLSIGGAVSHSSTGTTLALLADADNNGVGNLIVNVTGSVTSSSVNHLLDATGNYSGSPAIKLAGADIALSGTVTAGADGDILLHSTGSGRAVSLGLANVDFVLDNTEIGLLNLSSVNAYGGILYVGAHGATSGNFTSDSANFGSKRVSLISQGTINDAGAGVLTAQALTLESNGIIGGASGGGDGLSFAGGNLSIRGTGGNHATITATPAGTLSIRRAVTGGAGDISISNTAGTGLMTVSATPGFTGEGISTTGNLSLFNTVGSITQDASGSITAGSLTTQSAGSTTLTNFSNSFGTFVGSKTGVGDIDVRSTSTLLNIGNVSNPNGNFSAENLQAGMDLQGSVNVSGNVKLIARNALTQTGGSIIANALTAQTQNAAGALIALSSATNNVVSAEFFTANAALTGAVNADITYRDADAVSLGVAGSTKAVDTLGTLNITAGGALTQTLPVVAGTLNLATGANAATLNHTGNNVTTLNGTTGALQYTDADSFNISTLTVGGNSTLASAGAGAINLSGLSASAPSAITVNTAGHTTVGGFTGAVTSVTTDAPGTVSVSGSTGSAGLFLNEASGISLCGSVGDASAVVSFTGPVTLCGPTTITGISVTFNGALDSAVGTHHALTINSPGTTTFAGGVGDTQALGSIASDLGGSTVFVTGANSAGAITLMDIANLGGLFNSTGFNSQNAVLTSATTINAGTGQASLGLLNGAHALTVNSSGNTVFSLAVGGSTALASLTTDAAGTTQVHNNITSGSITFNDATSLRGVVNTASFVANAGLTVGVASATINAGAISIAGGINGAGGTFGLTLNSTGTTSITGGIGGTTTLASLTTNAGGTTSVTGNINAGSLVLNDVFNFQGGTVSTGGTQSYAGLNLSGATAFTSGAGFNNSATLNANGNNLAITTANPFQVIGPNFLNVNQFLAGGTGGVHLSGAFATMGNQTYNTPLTLFADSSLSAGTTSAIAFNGAVGGAFALGINGGTISQTAPISVSSVNVTGAQGIGLTNAANSFGAISATSAGPIGINATSATLTVNGITATGTGNVVIANSGAIVNNGTISVGSGSFTEVATGSLAHNGSLVSGGAALMSGLGLTLGGSSSINAGGGLTLNSGTGLLTTAGSVTTGNTPLALIADELALGGTLSAGTGTVVIDSATATRTIILGAPVAGTLSISNAALGTINGTSRLQIGTGGVHTGALRVDSAVITTRPEMLLLTKAGAIDINAGINVTGGTLTVNAGGGNIAVAPAAGAGALAINANDVFFSGGNVNFNGGAALNQSVAVNATNNLTVFSTGSINVLGGSGAGSSAALIATNNVTLNSAGALLIQGGAGAGAFAKVDPAFVEVTAGSVQLKGGGDGSYAQIAADRVNVQATAGNVNLDGGSGAGASASIKAVNGGASVTTLSSGQINLVGGTGVDSDAVILAEQSAFIQAGTCTGCVILTSAPGNNGTIETGVRGNPTVINNLIFRVVGGTVISQSLAELTDNETRALIRSLNRDLDGLQAATGRTGTGTLGGRSDTRASERQSDNDSFESATEGGTPTRSRTGSGNAVQSCSR